MAKTISLGRGAPLDLDQLIRSRLLLNANSGAGKSWALRRLLERSHGKVQQLVLDPEGEFHTLKERGDWILARPAGGDCVARPQTAKLLARRLLELGVSAVLDIYELDPPERQEFTRLFLRALLDAPRKLWHPCLVVVDEAHVYAPEKGKAASRAAVEALMSRGRKRGFCGILATQRIAKLSKDAAAEANNYLMGRCALDTDVTRAAEILGFSTAKRRELRTLDPGTFFAFGPALSDQPKVIRVGTVTTTHPEAGTGEVPVPPSSEKVMGVLSELEDLQGEAEREERELEDLKEEVVRLRLEMDELEDSKRKAQTHASKTDEIRQQLLNAESRLAFQRQELEQWRAFGKRMEGFCADRRRLIMDYLGAGKDLLQRFPEKLALPDRSENPPEPTSSHSAPLETIEPVELKPRGIRTGFPVSEALAPRRSSSGGDLAGGPRRLLETLCERFPAGLTEAQWASLVPKGSGRGRGMARTGGTWSTYKSALTSRSLVELEGSLWRATQAGMDLLGVAPAAPRSFSERLEHWKEALGGGPARLLQAVVDAGGSLERHALAKAVDLEVSGGTFSTYLSKLAANGLVVKRKVSGGLIRIQLGKELQP